MKAQNIAAIGIALLLIIAPIACLHFKGNIPIFAYIPLAFGIFLIFHVINEENNIKRAIAIISEAHINFESDNEETILEKIDQLKSALNWTYFYQSVEIGGYKNELMELFPKEKEIQQEKLIPYPHSYIESLSDSDQNILKMAAITFNHQITPESLSKEEVLLVLWSKANPEQIKTKKQTFVNDIPENFTDENEKKPSFNYCPNCGHKLFEGINFCPNCGNKLSETNVTPNNTSPSHSKSVNGQNGANKLNKSQIGSLMFGDFFITMMFGYFAYQTLANPYIWDDTKVFTIILFLISLGTMIKLYLTYSSIE